LVKDINKVGVLLETLLSTKELVVLSEAEEKLFSVKIEKEKKKKKNTKIEKQKGKWQKSKNSSGNVESLITARRNWLFQRGK